MADAFENSHLLVVAFALLYCKASFILSSCNYSPPASSVCAAELRVVALDQCIDTESFLYRFPHLAQFPAQLSSVCHVRS